MKGRHAVILGASVLCLTMSGVLAAAEYVTESGPYVGAAIGSSTYEEDLDDVASGLEFDESDTGWKLFGGYRFNRHFGVDVAYVDLGEPEDTLFVPLFGGDVDTSIEITGWNLSGVGYLPLGRWEFFGGLGIFAWDGEVTFSGAASGTDDDSDTDLSTRIGGSFAVTRDLRVRGEVESYDIGDYTSLFSFGVDYRF